MKKCASTTSWGGESVPNYLPLVIEGIAAILLVIGWRRKKQWLVFLAQAIAQAGFILALTLLLE